MELIAFLIELHPESGQHLQAFVQVYGAWV